MNRQEKMMLISELRYRWAQEVAAENKDRSDIREIGTYDPAVDLYVTAEQEGRFSMMVAEALRERNAD